MKVDADKYWKLICDVQLTVNFESEYARDIEQYRKRDFWAVMGSEKLGDCEDYALTKREILRAELPIDALRLATCWTELNGYHAVLVVVTDTGDYVLDNRHKWPVPWAELKYKWDKMQDADGKWRKVIA